MITDSSDSILLMGESDVGKTHYGAQLLKRLMVSNGELRMDGAATNLKPFEAALESLTEGKSAEHTPTTIYLESVWPIRSNDGFAAELVWPDYGGEQVRTMLTSRRVPSAWKERITSAPAWIFFIRLQRVHNMEDILSRPLSDLKNSHGEAAEAVTEVKMSDQARLIELLQMLLYIRRADTSRPLRSPRLALLLSCWDELGSSENPLNMLRQRLPMMADFVTGNWESPLVLGLSALGRPLKPDVPDMDYVARGPEHFGYVVLPDKSHSTDLSLPIKMMYTGLGSSI
jgi:Double-GTPase 1